MEDIESYTSQLLNKKYRKKDEKIGSAKHRFNKGDLLFSKLRIYLKKVIIADEDGFCTSEIMPLNFNGFCVHNYARYYFISSFFLKKVETMQYGCKMPRLGTNDAKQLLFPLPPLSEQERICEKVELILNRIKQISIDTTNISFYAESIKHKILESIFGNNSSYKSYYQFSDVFEFQNGYAFSSSSYSDKGTPIIRISDLSNGIVSLNNCIKVKDIVVDDKFIVYKGDLLIAMSGATTGKMGVFIDDEKCYLNQRVGNIKIKRKDVILPKYRDYLFMYLSQEILKSAYGGAQPNISSNKILAMSCYLPSLGKQQKQIEQIEKAFDCLSSFLN